MTDFNHYERNRKYRDRARALVQKIENVHELMHSAPAADAVIDMVIEYVRSAFDETSGFLSYCQHPRLFEFQRWRTAVGMLIGKSSEAANNLTEATTAWQMLSYERHGKRAYRVSAGLGQQLLCTSIHGLRASDVRLPYKTVWIEIDKALGFEIFNLDTGWHQVYGAYVTDDNRELRILLCGDPKDGASIWDDALAHYMIDLREDERSVSDILKALREHIRQMRDDQLVSAGLPLDHPEVDRIVGQWLAVFDWILNLIFYITRPDFDDFEHIELNLEAKSLWRRIQNLPRKSKKRTKLLERARACERRQRIVVGRKIKIDQRLPRTAASARKLRVRSYVAGHWQRYHVGPQRSEIKWKFRQPFWRGRDHDPESPSTHELL